MELALFCVRELIQLLLAQASRRNVRSELAHEIWNFIVNSTSDAIRLIPDFATQSQPHLSSALNWVGMNGIDSLVSFDRGDGDIQRSSTIVGAFVNLTRPDQRGIHMSCLYLSLDEYLGARAVDAEVLEHLLCAFLESQKDLADRARISIRFDQLVRRATLRSDNSDWRAYPVSIAASLCANTFRLELGTEVVYSSTCPASAALSRQLIQEQFARDFYATQSVDHSAMLGWLGSEGGIVAKPHAQRSVAQLWVSFVEGTPLILIALLDRVEESLGTPVQTAVKRVDEQAFALANGSNLMFCEDAARRIQHALNADNRITDFHIRLEHQESLHPHDAVAYASKDGVSPSLRRVWTPPSSASADAVTCCKPRRPGSGLTSAPIKRQIGQRIAELHGRRPGCPQNQ